MQEMSTLRMVPDQPARLTDRVAAEVRANMARVRMTQTELAEILGLTQSTVSKRLLGKIAFSVDELDTVAAAFGVHPAVLMGGVAQPNDNGPGTRAGTTDRYPRNLVTLREVFTIKPLPAQIVRAAA